MKFKIKNYFYLFMLELSVVGGVILFISPSVKSQTQTHTVTMDWMGFADDFEQGLGNEASDNGTATLGIASRWSSGSIVTDGNNVLEVSSATSTAGHSEWTDINFRAKIKTTVPGAQTWNVGRLLFRYQNTNNYYTVMLHNNASGTLELAANKAGVWSPGLASVNTGLDEVAWHNFRILVRSSNIRVFVDGVEYINYTDASPIASGKIGIVGDASTSRLDDVIVVNLGSSTAGQCLADGSENAYSWVMEDTGGYKTRFKKSGNMISSLWRLEGVRTYGDFDDTTAPYDSSSTIAGIWIDFRDNVSCANNMAAQFHAREQGETSVGYGMLERIFNLKGYANTNLSSFSVTSSDLQFSYNFNSCFGGAGSACDWDGGASDVLLFSYLVPEDGTQGGLRRERFNFDNIWEYESWGQPFILPDGWETVTTNTGACDGTCSTSPCFCFNWGTGAGWTSGPVDYWTSRYDGKIYIPANGSWQFRCGADDGCRIFIDGEIWATLWRSGSFGYSGWSVATTLNKGYHDIRIEYLDKNSNARLEAQWSGPGYSGAIPLANLYYPSDVYKLKGPQNNRLQASGGSATWRDGNCGTNKSGYLGCDYIEAWDPEYAEGNNPNNDTTSNLSITQYCTNSGHTSTCTGSNLNNFFNNIGTTSKAYKLRYYLPVWINPSGHEKFALWLDNIRFNLTYSFAWQSPTFSITSRSWANTDVNVTVSYPETIDIEYTRHCWNNGATCDPGTTAANTFTNGNPITQTAEGQWYLCTRARDIRGNWSDATCNGTYKIDKTAPTVTFNNPASASWQKADFSIDISDSDALSGLSSCEYKVDSYNGAWVETKSWTTRTCNTATSVTVTVAQTTGDCRNEGTGDNGNGACRVTVRATDVATNVTTLSARQFKIDWTAPGVPAPASAYNNSGFGVVVNWAQVTDSTSGLPTSPTTTYEIDRAVYSGGCGAYSNISSIANDSAPNDITAPAYYDSNGGAGLSEGTSYCWRVRATDVAGNWSNYGVVSNVAISDATPSGVPTGLSASPASTTQINLSWTASSGSPSKYNIYANITSSELNLISTIATGYADGGWYNLGGCPGTDTNIKVDDVCYGTASVAFPYISYYWASAKTLGTVITRYFDSDDRIYYNTKLQYSTDTTNGQDGVWTDATQKQNYASRALQEYDLNGTANLKGVRVYFNATSTTNAYKRIKYLEAQPSWIAQSATNSYNNTTLTANTQYYYKVDSCDASGNCSASTSAINKWTYAVIPSATCTSPASCNTTTKYTTTGFSFQSSAGWGGGGVQYYRYVWDQNKNYTFTGSESTWSDNNAKCPGASCTTANTTLSLTATQKGSWYLHLKSYNGEDASASSANSEVTYGPYYYDDLSVWWYPASGSAPNSSSFSASGSLRQIGSKYHYYAVDTAGKLFVLNANDGTLDWQIDSASAAVSSSTPTSYGNFVYFGNGDGKLYKIKDNDTAYSTAQADTGWATNPVQLGDGSDKSIKTTPMIVNISGSNRIIIASGEDLYCINDSNGSLCGEWTTNPRNLPNSGSPEQITATPTLSNIGGADANYIFVATQKTSSTAQVYKINKGDGTINATFNTDVGGVEKNISLRYYTGTNLYLYFGGITANKFYVVNSSMTQVYCVGSGCAQDPTGLSSFYSGVYISPFGGAIYIGNNNGKVYKLQGSDGACLWYYNAGVSILGMPVSWQGKVYFAASDGKFYVVTDTVQSACAQNISTITSFPYATGDLVYGAPTFYLSGTKVIIPSTVGRIFAFNMP